MRTHTRSGDRSWRRIATLAAWLLLAPAALVACGETRDADGQVASADRSDDSGGGGATTDPAAGMDDRERMLAFTECLRDNGLEVEDPPPGEGLQLMFGPGTDPETVDAAMEACREFAPAGAPGGGPGIDPEAAAEHAECMRQNGVDAFPDPDAEGRVMISPEVSNDPDFAAASSECDPLLGLAR